MGGLISRLLFQPPEPASYTKSDKYIFLECEDKKVVDERGQKVNVKIPLVFLECKGSDLCLLYSHGNATDLGQTMPYLELLRSSLKINVCGYEYQGYGISEPKVSCSEPRVYASIEAAVKYLKTERGFSEDRIIVFGTSLGTGPSTYIASKENSNFRGVILQSPFTTVVRIKVNTNKKIFFDMFRNIDRIDKVKCPVFIIHGKVDEVVPFEHGEILQQKVKYKYTPLFIDYAGHNNILEIMSVERYLKQIFKFIVYLNEFRNGNRHLEDANGGQNNGANSSSNTQ
ncbi:hypothetical protein FDP41_004544 [Naegleria fowleri]|uniref:Peptidase S9 prolyl oligopeptidase catalytic domain-containing protein n=1 Tax=Naegleria fowleri TaxID=5763 RepID=A0A6A5BTB9_NAEFO|nr:uncharacterized protein FDP41_004544 [Naegleria fowleri]KAF0976645.1 hypothetical protein FDP41_004544 [Naegleria fowleri]